jgi:hypothetical protein
MGETGTASTLNVDFHVRPEMQGNRTITFLASASYRDPYAPAESREVIRETLISGACRFENDVRIDGPYRWVNLGQRQFSATLVRQCRRVPLADGTSTILPFLETRIWCSDPQREIRETAVLKGKNLFQITPVTHNTTVPLVDRVAVDQVHNIYSTAGNVISIIEVVFKLVKLVGGNLTIEGFLVEVATDYLESMVKGRLIEAGIDYLVTNGGTTVRIEQDGWSVTCLLCFAHFVVPKLEEGQILKCQNDKCPGRARISFIRADAH